MKLPVEEKARLEKLCRQFRIDLIETLHQRQTGHPGGSLSVLILTTLYFTQMDVDPANPLKPDRDRLVLGKGHAAPALYRVLAEKGFFPVEEMATLRCLNSRLQGHPNPLDTPGVDITSGPLGLGLSGFFMNLTNSLVQVVCNATLLHWGGDLYVGVMTIINSVREVVVMPVHGLNNGSQPVTSFNYGAGKNERVRESIRFTVGATVLYSAAFWALAMLFPAPFIHIFSSEPEIVAAGIPALRLYFCMFIFMALQMSSQALIVSLGRAKQAIFFSLFRKAIVNAPLTVILPHFMGVSGVFAAEAISQLLGGLASSITMYFTVYRRLNSGAPELRGKGTP